MNVAVVLLLITELSVIFEVVGDTLLIVYPSYSPREISNVFPTNSIVPADDAFVVWFSFTPVMFIVLSPFNVKSRTRSCQRLTLLYPICSFPFSSVIVTVIRPEMCITSGLFMILTSKYPPVFVRLFVSAIVI